MKKIAIITTLLAGIITCSDSRGQTVLNTDFNAALPAGWTVDVSGGAKWEHSGNFGVSGSGCAMVDKSGMSNGTKSMLITPTVNLTTVAKPTLSFKLASIRNNFVAPYLYIYYSVAGGAWQKLSSWGEWQADNVINTTGPCFPQNSGCTDWQNIEYDLSAVANNTNIRFAFEADCLNGGWLLLDDVWIHDKKIYALPYTQDFEGADFFPQDWGRIGTNSQADWQRSVSVGAFNSTSSAFFDNFSLNVSGNSYGLSTVWLDLSTVAKPTLAFEYAYTQRIGKPSDELLISYQIGGSNVWVPLDSFKGNKLKTAPDKAIAFMPNNREWLTKTIDLSALASNNEIRFAITCKSENGNILYIDNVRFFNNTSTTSVGNVNEVKEMVLYPNPAQDVINIEMNKTEGVSLYVYDVVGRAVTNLSYVRDGQRLIMNTSMLRNGVYTIIIHQNNKNITEHFIINR